MDFVILYESTERNKWYIWHDIWLECGDGGGGGHTTMTDIMLQMFVIYKNM